MSRLLCRRLLPRLLKNYHTTTSLRMFKFPPLTEFGYPKLYEFKSTKSKKPFSINLHCYIAKINEREYVAIQTNISNYFKIMRYYVTKYPNIQLIYRYQIDCTKQYTTWYDVRQKLIENKIINSDMYSYFNIIKEDYTNDQLILDIQKYSQT